MNTTKEDKTQQRGLLRDAFALTKAERLARLEQIYCEHPKGMPTLLFWETQALRHAINAV